MHKRTNSVKTYLQNNPVERPRHKMTIFVAGLKLCLTISLIALLFYYIDIQQFFESMRRIDFITLFLAFISAVVATIILPSIVTKLSLSVGKIIFSFKDIILINLTMRFYVFVLPRFLSLGLRWLRYGKGSPTHEALALLAFERAVYLVALCLCSIAAIVVEFSEIGRWAPTVLITNVTAFTISLCVLLPFVFQPVARCILYYAYMLNLRIDNTLTKKLKQLAISITSFRLLEKRIAAIIVFISIISVLFLIITSYIVAIALKVNIDFAALTWIRAFVFAITLVPISFGGIGLREVGFVGLLSLYDVPAPEALAFALVNFGLQLAIAGVGGLIEACRHAAVAIR